MTKTVNIFLKLIVIILCSLVLLWTVCSFDYLIDMVTTLKFNSFIITIFIMSIVCYIMPKIFKINSYKLFYQYRYSIMAVLLITQILFVLMTSALAVADTTGVFESVQGISAPEYFSAYTNNYLYGMYVKGIISIFGANYAVLVQEIINILLLDATLLIVPTFLSRYISEKSGYKSFVFLLLTLGINQTIVSTYTDYLSIFTASMIFCFCIKFVNTKLKLYELLLFGMVISIGIQFRATSFIFIIGLVVVEVLALFMGKVKTRKVNYSKLFSIAIIIIGFTIPTGLSSLAKANQVVHYTPGQTKSLLYYLDLGLTSTGNNAYELPLGQLQYGVSSEKINDVVKKDLKQRVKKYTAALAFRKFKQGYQAGDFGWQFERVITEDRLVRNNITRGFIESKAGKFVRKQTFALNHKFLNYGVLLQITYIIVILEVLFALINIGIVNLERDKTVMYILVTLFGMFLYFGLFELGRSRYLFSFWPLIVSVSTIPYLKKTRRQYKENLSTEVF